MKKLLSFLMLMLPIGASAFSGEAEVDGIWYKIVTKAKTAEVLGSKETAYSGDIVIPPTIEYDGVTCNVSTINENAFYGCSNLMSVIIGNNVTNIGSSAFYNCNNLTTVTIGTSVKTIGGNAFAGCNSLTSVRITDLEAWCNISYDSNPFDYAHQLFLNDEEVKELVIPNSVTTIKYLAFSGCSSLKSVIIPNSVTSIDNSAFYGCDNLTTVTIGNGVTSIGFFAFYGCDNLTTVTIGNGVTYILEKAFADCPELTDFICYADNVPSICNNTFVGSYIDYATLHVPAASVSEYKTVLYWRNFQNIVAIDENASLICETPTISYSEGKLLFDCATEGVEFVTSVSFADESMHHSSEIPFATKYRISVYAKKDGYDDSDIVTCDVDFAKMIGDVNGDGEITIADAVEIVDIILGRNDTGTSQQENNGD